MEELIVLSAFNSSRVSHADDNASMFSISRSKSEISETGTDMDENGNNLNEFHKFITDMSYKTMNHIDEFEIPNRVN
jgi:hypothetical protein